MKKDRNLKILNPRLQSLIKYFLCVCRGIYKKSFIKSCLNNQDSGLLMSTYRWHQ